MNDSAYEEVVAMEIADLAERARGNRRLAAAGRLLNVECLVGTCASPVLLSIRGGAVVGARSAPGLLASWDFAFRANARAWMEFWQPMPKPGWHDLFALTKRGAATVEGNLHPFMSHLQYFKDLLSLPRGHVEELT